LVRVRFSGLEPNLLEVLVGFGLALAVLAVLGREAALLRWSLDLPVLVLLVAGTLVFLWSPDRHSSFGIYRQFLVEPVLAGYALYLLLRRAADLWLASWAVVAAGLVPAFGELYSAARDLHQVHAWDVHPPTGFYLNANFSAEMIVPALALAIGMALT